MRKRFGGAFNFEIVNVLDIIDVIFRSLYDFCMGYEIDPEEFISAGRATPFEKVKVAGRCLATLYGGKAVYVDKKLMDI